MAASAASGAASGAKEGSAERDRSQFKSLLFWEQLQQDLLRLPGLRRVAQRGQEFFLLTGRQVLDSVVATCQAQREARYQAADRPAAARIAKKLLWDRFLLPLRPEKENSAQDISDSTQVKYFLGPPALLLRQELAQKEAPAGSDCNEPSSKRRRSQRALARAERTTAPARAKRQPAPDDVLVPPVPKAAKCDDPIGPPMGEALFRLHEKVAVIQPPVGFFGVLQPTPVQPAAPAPVDPPPTAPSGLAAFGAQLADKVSSLFGFAFKTASKGSKAPASSASSSAASARPAANPAVARKRRQRHAEQRRAGATAAANTPSAPVAPSAAPQAHAFPSPLQLQLQPPGSSSPAGRPGPVASFSWKGMAPGGEQRCCGGEEEVLFGSGTGGLFFACHRAGASQLLLRVLLR
jgi:hypothetical protein